ncbi:N-acetylgalactosamine-N,N'-diacetylbacillosaminyl-diphospho-undecaprenol 4-alpha-N-acetylgalactosaminyltransferase [Brevundimonas subvibrioides]|uniref:glycosyltransferase family 4 protein n=1 Tax=Brevundimonas subvibrioides TaxID=74313 RepID=UPI0032D57477
MTDRLFLFVAAFFPDSYGGAERQARILAEALGRRGVDVTIVAPTVSPEAPLVEATAFGRIERFRVATYPNAGGRHIGSFLRWTAWVRRTYRHRLGPDAPAYVFHARLHALGPALAAMASGAPLLIKLGGGGEASDFAALRAKRFFYGDWVQSLLLRRVDAFVANSGQIAEDLRALGVGPDRIEAFPNGVVIPAPSDTPRSGDRFVFAGRLSVDKRIEVLCDAGVALAGDARPPRLTLLGDGPDLERLQARVRAAGAEAAVAFPGFAADVYPEMMRSDFFVSASLREGQSNALLEAMACGVIPVVAGASGVSEVVQHGVTGFVVDRPDAEGFAAVMRTALALPEARRRQMSEAARRHAADHIGIDAIAGRTLEALDASRDRRRAGRERTRAA